MKRFITVFLCLILILGISLAFSYAAEIPSISTGSALFSRSPGLFALADSTVNPNAFPYWSTSSVFNLTQNGSVQVSFDGISRYLVGVHPANQSGFYSYVIFAPSDQFTSVNQLSFSGSVHTVSSLSSYDSNYNYVWLWVSDSLAPNVSIPYSSNLNTDLSLLSSYAGQSYDLNQYIWQVPKLSDLSYNTLSSSPARLRSSSPYLYYGSTSKFFYRAILRDVKTSSTGGNVGEVFYNMFLYTQYDPTEIIADTVGFISPSDEVVSYPGSRFYYDESLQLWTFSFQVTNTASGGAVDVPCFNDSFTMKSCVAAYFNTSFNRLDYISIPCGNALYIDLGSSGTTFDLSLSCDMPTKSYLVGINPFLNTQFYLFASSLPSEGTSLSQSDGTLIDWSKSSDGRNLFGMTNKAVFSLSGTSSARYLVIVNPLFYSLRDDVLNGSVQVSNLPVNTRVYSYPLQTGLGSDLTGFSNIISGVGGTGVSSSDGSSVPLVSNDNSSLDYISPYGGSNDLSVSQDMQGTISGLRDTLSNFFNSILELLGKPVEYIQNLISAGSAFIQQISGLWSWLPAEVVTIVTSALVVVICVAVFKVFL